MKEEKEVPRGTKVTSYNDKIDKDNTNYTKIEYEKIITMSYHHH